MKDAVDTPVTNEASPLVVGGKASKPKRTFNKRLWTRVVLIAAALLFITSVAVAGWWFFIREDPNYLKINQLNSQNERIAKAQSLAELPLPKSPQDQAIHYGDIAAELKVASEYTYAEHYYLTAQKIVDKYKLNKKDINFYMGLADVYRAMGNKQKADEYDRKLKELIQASYSSEQIKQMEKAQYNGRPR